MKAAYFVANGGPEVIQYGELPLAELKGNEVRIRVLAASLNPIDTYIRSGMAAMPGPFPFVTGRDFAGVIEEVGPEVSRWKVGDQVWGANQGAGGRPGSIAEQTIAKEEWVYPLPDNVEAKTAAAFALTGITAHLGLFLRAGLKAGETVFVHGGTGGVGSMVIQVAKAHGAKVITTVGSPEKQKIAKSFGADFVINYKSDNLEEVIKEATQGRGVDVWYETQPPTNLDQTIEMTAQRGRIVLMAGRKARPELPNGPLYVKGQSLLGFAMFNYTAAELAECAQDLNRLASAGQLKAMIGREMPFAQASEAHKLQEENTLQKAGSLTGKIVLVP